MVKISELKTIDEVAPSLNRAEYARWWQTPGMPDCDPLTQTLARHVIALQDKLDKLPEELWCGCAYDHPDDMCMTHRPAADPPSTEGKPATGVHPLNNCGPMQLALERGDRCPTCGIAAGTTPTDTELEKVRKVWPSYPNGFWT